MQNVGRRKYKGNLKGNLFLTIFIRHVRQENNRTAFWDGCFKTHTVVYSKVQHPHIKKKKNSKIYFYFQKHQKQLVFYTSSTYTFIDSISGLLICSDKGKL